MKKKLNKAIAAVTALGLLSSCASTTVLRSSPPDAKVYLDGSLVGRTPFTLTDQKITGAVTQVKLVREGCGEFSGVLTKSEEVNVGAVVGGLFFLVPFLWTMGYKTDHMFEIDCASGQQLSH